MKERKQYPCAVHAFIQKPSGEILLLRRQNTGYEDGKWSVPAGHVEASEGVVSTLTREVLEETGLSIHQSGIHFAHAMQKRDPVDNEERIDFFFWCRSWDGVPHNCEPHKCSALEWRLIQQLPPTLIQYVRAAIECSISRSPFSQFGFSETPLQAIS